MQKPVVVNVMPPSNVEDESSEYGGSNAPIMLGFKDLNIIDSASQIPLLHDVSGFVVKGGITGMIGPSSSGKTLLMKALAGRVEEAYFTGEVVVDGKIPNFETSNIAFEDDVLVGVLTLRESLEISMMLRRDVSETECKRSVSALIENLELSHVANSKIGTVLQRGLSGGQKRRTSVGVELVADSCMFFVLFHHLICSRDFHRRAHIRS